VGLRLKIRHFSQKMLLGFIPFAIIDAKVSVHFHPNFIQNGCRVGLKLKIGPS